MSEAQRGRWTLSLPIVTEHSQSMEEVTGIVYSISEQHTDTSSARITHDNVDARKVLDFLKECSPYTSDECLKSIVTGVVADDSINVDALISVGNRIVNTMDGKDVFTYSFSQKGKVNTLSEPRNIKCGHEEGKTIDPALLFQRLLVVSDAGNDEIKFEEVMEYKLPTTFPPALFDSQFLPRKANKPPLMDSIEDAVKQNNGVCYGKPATDVFVLDGGSHSYRINWKKNETFGNIAKQYALFVNKRMEKLPLFSMGTVVPQLKVWHI